ncbi:MAG: NADH-quinone oxidoreductase subunit C [Actinobacteria bacterium]|nr:NADH-quinone oxidoreductase subunit C [Actinomycetota bacterium]MCL5888084.1 NADH-quinone oxidoreductase subunit C [Actinomycetota bacterium]
MRPDVTAVDRALTSFGSKYSVCDAQVGIIVACDQSDALPILQALRDSELDFAMLLDLFGRDVDGKIEITYHLRSYSRDQELYVRCHLDHDGDLHSVWTVYPSALMPERETAELYGLTLSDHPNPKRLLTTDGVPPLLRKSVPIRTVEEVRSR